MGRHWQQVTPPSVVWLFDRRSLRRALGTAGFTDVRFQRGAKYVGVGQVAGLLAGKHPRLLGWCEPLVRWLGLAGVAVRYGLGDLVVVTARRGR